MNMMKSPDNILASRAMVAHLHISQWTGRRLDREVTDELNQDKGAKKSASRVNKLLLPEDALKPIVAVVSETRNQFLVRTLPWLTDGGRILPSTSFMDTAKWIKDQKVKFFDAVDSFTLEYPNYVQQARTDLGAMFKAEDYPDAKEIATKFAMEMKCMPVPQGKDFRVDLADEQLSLMRAEVEKNVAEATEAAMKDVFARIADVSGKMVERLSAYSPARRKGEKTAGAFRDSLVTNVRDLVAILPALNITGDDRLTDLTKRLEVLSVIEPQALRDKPDVREGAKREAKRILDMVSGWTA